MPLIQELVEEAKLRGVPETERLNWALDTWPEREFGPSRRSDTEPEKRETNLAAILCLEG
ncbi:MAG: hypothetical protein P4L81_05055 [Candidatus Pacebacteria bacterium]|nr:hypothetical protein [Candidatus Paceibacterota bacterium]